MRLVARARKDLRTQQRALALERRTDGGGDRGVDGARERQPLGRRPVRVRRRGRRAQRPFVVGLPQQVVQLAQHAPNLFGGRDLPGRQAAPQVGGLLIDVRAHLFHARDELPALGGGARRLQLGEAHERDLRAVARVDRPIVQRAATEREARVDLTQQQRPRHAIARGQRRGRQRLHPRAQRGQRRHLAIAPRRRVVGQPSSNRRSPISVACSGCARRCSSQYRVASAASACGGAIASVGSTGGACAPRDCPAGRAARGPARKRQDDQQRWFGERARHGRKT